MPFLNIPLEGLSSEELNKFCAKSSVKEVKDKNYVAYEAYIASIFEKLARIIQVDLTKQFNNIKKTSKPATVQIRV